MQDQHSASDEIICEKRERTGFVTLNRPKALNAITLPMVQGLAKALDAWEQDPAIERVVVVGAGDRAFSAGGDIRKLHDQIRGGGKDEALAFWAEEYRLNIRIKRYPKPYVALIDGIVMGGGVGLSLHGSHRVAGDRYRLAMPEVGIGFFPDVGATYALPRLPGRTGLYIALTGERVGAADAVALGLATHAVSSGVMAELQERLLGGAPLDEILAAASATLPDGPITEARDVIDSCFSGESVPAILARLDEAARGGSAFAEKTAAAMRTKSPTSLRLAFEQMRRGATLDFEDAMKTEYRIVSRIADGHDFPEGVRAAIIDKDGAPRWNPARLEDVGEAAIAAHFASLGDDELRLAP